ncbi:hypothetical protein [Methylocystis echinoides]|uniref:Uncharacterized protein n=1 Tax=Methylocystis echinoides TaxID=29468 RepID=A0A9W6GZ69_9HYPH|nr:hypothetical protein [Methylocystis echinoides]GLI95584.1 hypothetical protein LMG27198_45760 [Methylocystis echinoides]
MPAYQIREIKIIEGGNDRSTLRSLREYERQSTDNVSIIAEVRHFFEMELSNPKALQTVDFDAIIVTATGGVEIARFSVSDFWCREWRESSFNPKVAAHHPPETLAT